MNIRHERFIREMIAHGNRIRAYQMAYPCSTQESARVNACRLLANPAIKERITAKLYIAEQAALDEVKEQFIEKVADTIDKRIALARIVRGEFSTRKFVAVYNKVYQVQDAPSVTEVLRAIDLDNKLAHRYKRKV